MALVAFWAQAPTSHESQAEQNIHFRRVVSVYLPWPIHLCRCISSSHCLDHGSVLQSMAVAACGHAVALLKVMTLPMRCATTTQIRFLSEFKMHAD